jgi:uncharacterized surface protein with fasciclin (FAS1) repeats
MKTLSSLLLAVVFVSVTGFTANAQGQMSSKSKAMDIVDLAASQDFLSTLVAAVKAGGLVETLKGKGPFTVFAPTNEAFAALPAGTLESLLKPENKDQLVKILTYHVVSGKVMSTDLKDGMTAKTVQGSEVKIGISKEGVKVNDAKVTSADIAATNGVVHVIDKVILPPAK